MDPIRATFFRNGFWTWDEVNNGLLFTSRDIIMGSGATTGTNITGPKGLARQSVTELKFRETVGDLEQIKFRRYYQRRCKQTDPKVITIQDVKDVALFIANIKEMSKEFIKYFHIPTMDRFLRALIVYFQYYIQVWDIIIEKREEAKRKLYQPVVTELENIIRDDLADLRAMVAREYCSLILGNEDAKKYHHMSNKNNDSLSDRDRRLFETLIRMAVRVVWIVLQRKHLNLIESEMNRLLRTDIFNVVTHHRSKAGICLKKIPSEQRLLTGTANTDERKLLHRSPIAKELILAEHDHRMLVIGIKQFEPQNERLNYLEIALTAPEELLIILGVTVGMLGIPRHEYDAMLMNLARSKNLKKVAEPRVLPPFKLPPKPSYREQIEKTLPQKPPKYRETRQTIEARRTQCKMWCQVVEKLTEGELISLLDVSISPSHVGLLTSRSSMSIANKEPSSTPISN